jgi:hypothetical protein
MLDAPCVTVTSPLQTPPTNVTVAGVTGTVVDAPTATRKSTSQYVESAVVGNASPEISYVGPSVANVGLGGADVRQ